MVKEYAQCNFDVSEFAETSPAVYHVVIFSKCLHVHKSVYPAVFVIMFYVSKINISNYLNLNMD